MEFHVRVHHLMFFPAKNGDEDTTERVPPLWEFFDLAKTFCGDNQAHYQREEGYSFDKGGGNQHGGLDFAGSFGLTGDAIHSLTRDATDSETGAQHSQSGANSTTHNSNGTCCVHLHSSN
jgi:hypothetical protein